MEKTFETPGEVRLHVQNEVGLVAITAARTKQTVVWIEADTPGAEELVEHATVECRPRGRGHAVVVKIPKQGIGRRFIRRNAVTVRIEMPEGGEVTVMAASADVEVTGTIGAADFTTSSGDVAADDVAGNLTVRSASGDVTVGTVDGDVKVQTASGDLRCSSIEGRAVFTTASGDIEVGAADGQVEVKATSGDVRLGELAHGARVTNVSGDVRVLAIDAGTLHVRSVSGNVSVGVVTGVELHVDVETMSGEVHSDIPLDDRPGTTHKDVLVELSVRSVSGNVEIERALEQVA